jgi:hypothetical protein
VKTILAMIIAGLIFAAPLLAEPPKAPDDAQSLSYLTSQAQKIKLGFTREAEVIQLLGPPQSMGKTYTKMKRSGSEERKVLRYGPEKNLIIRFTDGVVSRVEMP